MVQYEFTKIVLKAREKRYLETEHWKLWKKREKYMNQRRRRRGGEVEEGKGMVNVVRHLWK